MDLPTFLSKIRSSIANVLRRETAQRSIRCQTTTWIRYMKEYEYINRAFNSRMTLVYMLSDIDSIVKEMINHMVQQIDNPKLRDSKFVFEKILHTDISNHRLVLTRGSRGSFFFAGLVSKKESHIKPKEFR